MRHLKVKVAAVLGILLISNFALANPIANQMFGELLDFGGWLTAFDTRLEAYRPDVFRLSLALCTFGAITGAIYNMLQGVTNPMDFLSRIMLAGIILGVGPSINRGVVAMWEDARVIATTNLRTEYEEAATAFERIGEASVDIMVTSAIYGQNPNFIGTQIANQITGSRQYEKVRTLLARVTNLALPMLMVAVLFMFFLLVMSGIVITLAGMILPISAALITFPGSLGFSLLGSYIRAVMSSLLLILLFPVFMSAIFDLTATRPALRLAESLETNNAQIDATVTSIDAETSALGVGGIEDAIAEQDRRISEFKNNPANRAGGYDFLPVTLRPWAPGQRAAFQNLERTQSQNKQNRINALEAYGNRVSEILSGNMATFGRNVRQWIFTLIFLITMLIIGVFAMFKFESYVANLVGGLVLGAGGAMATLAVAAGAMTAGSLGLKGFSMGSGSGPSLLPPPRNPAPHSQSNVGPKALGAGAGSGLATRGGGMVPSGGSGSSGRATAYIVRPAIGGGGPSASLPGTQRALPPPKR